VKPPVPPSVRQWDSLDVNSSTTLWKVDNKANMNLLSFYEQDCPFREQHVTVAGLDPAVPDEPAFAKTSPIPEQRRPEATTPPGLPQTHFTVPDEATSDRENEDHDASGTRKQQRRAKPSSLANARLLLAFMASGLLTVGVVFAIDAPGATALSVTTSGLSFLLYTVSGLIASSLRPDNRIGMLMVVTGLSMWLADLANAPQDPLALLGAIASSLPLALAVHLLLAFPSGVVPSGIARWTVGVGYFVSIVLQVPRYLCGSNRFSLFPAFSDDAVQTVHQIQSAVGIGSVVATAVILAVASLRTSTRQRKLLGPLVWYRIAVPLLIGLTSIGVTSTTAGSLANQEFEITQDIVLASLPVVFLFGLLRGSFGRAGEVRDMVVQLGAATPTSGDLSAAVAAALGDPLATVLYRRGDDYVSESGAGVGEPHPISDRRLIHPVRYNGAVVGAIAYDGTMLSKNTGLEEIGRITAMCIEQRRLAAEQQQILADLDLREEALRQSRRRLVQAADTERRRIARDLHDGAQQHLVVLGLDARQLSRRTGDPEIAAGIASVADGLTDLNSEIRRLVAGIMPDSLMQGGLVAAIRTLAERMPVPTRVRIDGIPERLPTASESTAYFTVAEALTNAAKHARATSVEIDVEHAADRLVVEVIDDGVGQADPAHGSGLTGLADRIGALGGTFDIRSGVGRGTRIRAEIPAAPRPVPVDARNGDGTEHTEQ